jgi:uncharacterized protein YecE (DUF72 family)
MKRFELRVGCSGWQYKHWRGDFYPAGLATSRWFAHYALHFDTVEINNTFYRLPEAETFAKWREQAPPRFVYAVKASRFLTHMKKLKEPEEPLERFFDRATELKTRLGPVLYQLPPRWPLDLERFEHFVRSLRAYRHRPVVEFREPSWYDDRVFALMERHGVALCLHDMQGSPTGRRMVGPLIYVRFHGWTKYAGRYGDETLDEWADWLAARTGDGLSVYAYFNNDIGGHAPRDATRLRERLHARLGI